MLSSSRPGTPRPTPFSLVELLVVISIIAVIASMLLPSLARAREAARSQNCLNQLRQIGIGTAFYMDEHNDYLFAAQPPDPIGHWLNYYFVEVCGGQQKLLNCPTVQTANRFNPYGGTGVYNNLTQATYLMNIITPGNASGGLWDTAALSTPRGQSYGWAGDNSTYPVRITSARHPGESIMVTDSPDMPFSSSSGNIGIQRFGQTDHGLIDQNGNGVVNSSVTVSSSTSDRKVGWHHNGRFNALYGDGHGAEKFHTLAQEWVVYVK